MPNIVSRLTNLPAPAKLNLFLHVTGRREDGMHLLESVFILIDLADTIDIEVLDDGRIERTGDVIGDPERDLCVRAARLLQQASGSRLGARIRVTKRIPAGAGMGGGSSDAATTLLALNRLWDIGMSDEELMALAAQLGADVPFFVFGRNAFASGIGERLIEVPVPDSCWAIAMPSEPTSTAAVFTDPTLTRDTKSLKIADFSDSGGDSGKDRALARSLFAQWPTLPGHNDLEAVARRINPGVEEALEALSAAGGAARMTGSGSAVFAWAATPEAAAELIKKLPEHTQGYVAKTLHAHPLKAMLETRF